MGHSAASTESEGPDAVRRAIWGRASDRERAHFHDALVSAGVAAGLSESQLEIAWRLVPEEIVAGAIEWGLADTEVRDQVFAFAKADSALIKERIHAG